MKTVRRVLLPLLLLAVGATGVEAQQKAYSIPVSKKIVRLEVQIPDGHWIKGAVLEGDQFRVEDRDLKFAMAFIPVVKETGVQVRTFRIEKNANGDERMSFVENLDSGLGDAVYTKKDVYTEKGKASLTFGVRVVKVVEPPADADEHSPAKN